MPRIIMNRAFIARWTRMLHSTGRLSASASSHHGLSSAAFITNIAESDFRHAQGSVSVTPRATTSRPFLMTSQYQRPSPPLGIMRNSTFAMLCCLRPEMSIRVNQDTIHRAALRAQKSTQAQLSAPRRNIGHLIHRGGAFLAVSWSHHKSQRLDRPSGFLTVIVTPRGILLVVHMPNDRHRNQNDGCAED